MIYKDMNEFTDCVRLGLMLGKPIYPLVASLEALRKEIERVDNADTKSTFIDRYAVIMLNGEVWNPFNKNNNFCGQVVHWLFNDDRFKFIIDDTFTENECMVTARDIHRNVEVKARSRLGVEHAMFHSYMKIKNDVPAERGKYLKKFQDFVESLAAMTTVAFELKDENGTK